MKLVAIFKQPTDAEAFEEAYFNTHMPLMEAVPGLIDYSVTRFTRTIMGEKFYLMNEMKFADKESLLAAMKSSEMAAAGENLNSFAEGLVTLLFAEN
jgi:uncharacterized protein (TIGR02118 family)